MTSPEEQHHLFDQALSKLSVFAPVHLKEKHTDNIRIYEHYVFEQDSLFWFHYDRSIWLEIHILVK